MTFLNEFADFGSGPGLKDGKTAKDLRGQSMVQSAEVPVWTAATILNELLAHVQKRAVLVLLASRVHVVVRTEPK